MQGAAAGGNPKQPTPSGLAMQGNAADCPERQPCQRQKFRELKYVEPDKFLRHLNPKAYPRKGRIRTRLPEPPLQ